VVTGATSGIGAATARRLAADVAEWDHMLDVNVRGLLRTGRAFAADLLAVAADGRPADLVHVGSIGGHEMFPDYGVYCATKAAVAHLTRNLRSELGPKGVRVKSVEPGIGALVPADIADAIAFAVGLPANVNVAELIVLPTKQG